jgi:Thiamine pyrophosphate enzyme, central domain
MEQTIGELVSACLRAQGARRVFGGDLPGLDRIAVVEADLARLLADADGRIASRPGVAFVDDQVLRLSSRPGTDVDPTVVTDPERLPGMLASWAVGEVHTTVELRLDLDLDAPAPAGAQPLQMREGGDFFSLNPSLAEIHLLVLAGPGVVRDGKVAGLQEFAARAGVGVLNTWGAKGVFRWDSPHHFGTGGLQELDYELAGFGAADAIVAVGVDDDEAPRERWAHTQVLDVEPWQLPALAFDWPDAVGDPVHPRLYTELAAALQPLYASEELPLSPARAAADLAQVRPDGGVVVADPGPAGLWVARCYPTTEPGSVVVPATVVEGFAAAAAWVAGLDGRPAIGVTTTPLDEQTARMVELAESLGGQLVLEGWGADSGLGDPESHAGRLDVALQSSGVRVLPTPVDFSATQVLVDVAGPVVAWTSTP